MELRRQGIINSSPHLVSLSDSGIVSFDTDMKSKVKECTVHFSPVQATGTPAPDNVLPISGWTGVEVDRAGVNLFDINGDTSLIYDNIAIQNNRIVISSIGSGASSRVYFSTLYEPGTYTFSGKYSGDITAIRVFSSKPFTDGTYNAFYGGYFKTLSNGSVTITVTEQFNIGVIATGAAGGQGDIYDLQLELGSTPTSYTPYTGATYSITFPVMGKNLFNADDAERIWVSVNGSIQTNNAARLMRCSASAGETYTISNSNASSADNILLISYWDEHGTILARSVASSGPKYVTYVAPNNTAYMLAGIYRNDLAENVQLEKASSATAYEPYTNTIYGGYVDLVKGELVAEWGMVDLGTLNYSNDPNRPNVKYSGSLTNLIMKKIPWADAVCSEYQLSKVGPDLLTNGQFGTTNAYGSGNIYFKDDAFVGKTTAEINEYLSGVQLVYKLATPITYQLTPQQLNVLKGTNNVWSNANGTIDLSFWAHKEPNGGLPLEYRRVEYIATPNTPGPYIQTNFVPSEDYKIELAFYKLGTINGDSSFFFGSRVPASGYHSYALQLYSGGNFYGACWSASYSRMLSATYNENVAYHVKLTSTSLVVGESTAAPSGSLDNESSLPPLVVLARRRGDTVEYHSMNLGLGYLRFTNNHGIVALNLVPCIRKSDDKPGMYDTVTKTFYTNAGTGEFIVPNN